MMISGQRARAVAMGIPQRMPWFWASEDINHRVDISATFDLKLAALRCHESQLKEFPIPNLEDWLKKRSLEMAEGEDFEMAEAFHREVIPW